jgi:cytochrome b
LGAAILLAMFAVLFMLAVSGLTGQMADWLMGKLWGKDDPYDKKEID